MRSEMGKKHLKFAVMVFIILFYNCINLYSAEEVLPDAEEIIKKYHEAICGKDECKNIRNQKIETTQILQAPLINLKTIEYREKPCKSLFIGDMGAINKTIEGTDGEIVWKIDRREGVHIFKGKKLAERLLALAFEEDPDNWKKMYKDIKTKGFEDVNNRVCYKVVFISHSGLKKTRYYDKENNLMLKEEWEKVTDKEIEKEVFFYEDYQDYDGFLQPKITKRYIYGEKEFFVTETINRIKNNIEMPEGIFDPPEEIKTLIK